MAEILDPRQIDTRGGQRSEGADVRRFRRARHLGDDDPAAFDGNQVSEGSSDLDSDAHIRCLPAVMLGRFGTRCQRRNSEARSDKAQTETRDDALRRKVRPAGAVEQGA